jgi:beta-galactosidase
MKKILFSLLGLVSLTVSAQTADAFKGVWPVTDKAMMRSLNGEWQLKVVKGITNDKAVPRCDDSWGRIPVPGCWEPYGFSKPKYDYPDSLTGYYRTSFAVPAEWKGQQVIISLDGVLRGYNLWLNDQLVGTWESGYNTCLFDLTPYLTKKAFNGEPQQLAMRVYSQFQGYEFDCFDDWATMGIFRDVTLMAVPKTHLSDLTVTTKMSGEVTVKAEVANATSKTTTDYEILDAQGRVVSTNGKIENPQLWTAETPYLYTLRLRVKEKGNVLQTFTQKIGIRETSIEGNVLKLNGRPVKLRGVNAHSTDPNSVKVISDDLTLKDMKMMKEASVNYMRLSHYPREPRFYELADSLGFYLVNEVPFGYGDKHLGSRSYQDILKTRALATVTRDKNHPSVLIWSVGNENPLPQTCIEVGDYVGQLDASRPFCFPQVGSYFRKFWEKAGIKPSENGPSPFPSKAPIYAPHYPTTSQMRGFYQHLDRPVVFTEYCHTLGVSLEDHDRQWEIIERTPGIAGGSVWEWADQGMPFKMRNDKLAPRNGQAYGYEERVFTLPLQSEGAGGRTSGFEMFGNKGTDGVVYADRTPLPNYYELQHNYAQAFVRSVNCDGVAVYMTVHNRYDFLNLKDNVAFHWTLTNDRDTVVRGAFSPDCAPRSSVPYTLALPAQKGLAILHFDIVDKAGHAILHQSFVLNKPQTEWTGHGSGSVLVQETAIRTGRKPTMAERLKQGKRLLQKYLLPIENEQVKADIQSRPIDGGEELTVTLTPDSADVFRSELGLAYLLDARIDRVQWIGQGPFASYPGRHQANRYGFWAKHEDDLYFEGNHGGVDAAFLSDKDGNGILIVGDSLDLNFEQTDRGIVLTVNAAVSGQGPKFSKTAFNGWKPGDGPVSATFRSYYIKGDVMPQVLKRLFSPAAAVPAPFKPFLTQYDTYLMKYNNIKQE